MRKSPLLFVIALFLISIVVAQELSLEVGDYIITGEDVDEGVAGEVRFDDFDIGDISVEITSSSEEFIILLEGVRGTLDEDGIVHGVAELDGAYISIQLDPSTAPRVREFEESVAFTYDIRDDELTIIKGGVHIGDERIEAEKDSEFSIIGREVFLDGQGAIESIGSVDMQGYFVPRSDGILFSGKGEVDSATDELFFNGDVLYANDAFNEKIYDGAYFQLGDSFLKMKSVEGTELGYRPLAGNDVLDKRHDYERFYLHLTNGGEVAITNREDSLKTPLVDVLDGTGVKVVNGWYTDDERTLFIDPPTIETAFDLSGAITTLPLVVYFPDNVDAIFSSANGYVLLDNEKEVARYNDIGAPITDDFSDNDVRTIEELEKVWPTFEFKIEQTGQVTYTPSSATIAVTDQWLQDHSSTTPMKTLVFSDKKNTARADPSSRRIYFPDVLYEITQGEEELLAKYGTDRELAGKPYDLLTHENTHLIVTPQRSLVEKYNQIATRALENLARDELSVNLNSEIYTYIDSGDTGEFLEDAGTDALQWYDRRGDISYLSDAYIDICFPNSKIDSAMRQCQVQFEQLAGKYGLPAGYALRNYGTRKNNRFDEMPTTWIEEPLMQRWYRANLGNEFQREVYTQLAQLAYDSDQISDVECKIILIHDCEKGVLWDSTVESNETF